MTKRIFRSICIAALAVLAASAVLIMGMLYDYFSGVQKKQLRSQTAIAAHGIANEGVSFFYNFDPGDLRVTWVSPDGAVLYDTKSDSERMENHLERKEIKEAVKNGYGESERYSDTLTERLYYSAQRLPDGSIVRLAVTQNSVVAIVIGMLRPICIVFVIAVVLSLILASSLSKRIVKPLNDIDLDNPLANEGYDELSPLLRRIDAQQRQLRRQKQALERRKDEFSAVTGNMNEGLMLLNRDGIILTMNPAAAKILQADGDSAGKEILTVNRSMEMIDAVRKVQNGEHSEHIISIGENKFRLEVNPIETNGELSGAAVLLCDVTAREQAEQQRREFTANVSHELKTPLHSISGYAELIVNGMAKPEDIPEFAQKIYTEAKRLIALVEDIIRLSRLDEGMPEANRETVELFGAAEAVTEQLRSQADKAGVSLSLKGDTAEIAGAGQLVNGIIYNLCDNAIKYNKPGGSVEITVKNEENDAVLCVRDTGIGIPASDIERVFERFYRVDKSRSKNAGGTGLGLSIVKHSAGVLGARIDIKSRVNEGTAVTVYFPKQ